MRILYSHRIQSRDGQGVHLDALVAALREAGHEVRLVGPAAYDRATLGGESRLLSRLRQWLPRWAAEIAEIAYAVPACLRLRRAALEFAPDIIYERANLFHFAGSFVARRLGIPLILEVNSPLAEERARFGGLRLRRIATAAEAHVWRSADVVLPVTAVLADRIIAAGVPRERIVVIPNGIDTEDFANLPQRTQSDTLVLGFVGFVRAWHGLDQVLHGLAAWQGAQRLSLLVVGDGPARPDLERLARELGIADRVTFTGLAKREEVPALVARFDVALQPASVPYASPLKVFEYMAAARPIIAPDQPNIREVLEDGRTALLFDPSRPGAFWEGIERLVGDDALRARLGEAAREEILRRDLTWSGNARRVASLARAANVRSRPLAEQPA